MKIFVLECTEGELRANRGIMDAIVDACQGVTNTFFGTITPCCPEEQEEELHESEEQS